eukprot:Nk52_evm53s215 gene=Nk52_evmTU53s215
MTNSLFKALETPASFAEDRRQQQKELVEPIMGNPNCISFDMPAVQVPREFLDYYCDDAHGKTDIKMNHGTTTLSFIFNGGIIVAVDSRATAGSYIASSDIKKYININKYMVGTMAGGAADCSFWERELTRRCRLYELRNGERISVAAASKILGNMVYSYKGMGLSMGTMVAGYDKTGPNLFYVDSDGTRLKGDIFSTGSGSTYAYGVLDNYYRKDLSVEEAAELGRRAIYHATHRDAYSGNTINVIHITAEGWKLLGNYNVLPLHYEYCAQQGRTR